MLKFILFQTYQSGLHRTALEGNCVDIVRLISSDLVSLKNRFIVQKLMCNNLSLICLLQDKELMACNGAILSRTDLQIGSDTVSADVE